MTGLICLAASASSVAHACRAIRVVRSVAIVLAASPIRVVRSVARPLATSPIGVIRSVAVMLATSPIRVVRSVPVPLATSPIRVVRSVAVSVARHAWRGNVPIRLSGRGACSYQCNTAYQCLNLIHRTFLKYVLPSMAVRSSVTPTVSFTSVRKD
jgi:hypothetical protein